MPNLRLYASNEASLSRKNSLLQRDVSQNFGEAFTPTAISTPTARRPKDQNIWATLSSTTKLYLQTILGLRRRRLLHRTLGKFPSSYGRWRYSTRRNVGNLFKTWSPYLPATKDRQVQVPLTVWLILKLTLYRVICFWKSIIKACSACVPYNNSSQPNQHHWGYWENPTEMETRMLLAVPNVGTYVYS